MMERGEIVMIKTVASVKLPVNETLEIKKNRFILKDGGNGKRISIVTGIHGDELEGQYVCYEVARRIQENPQYLHGTVDIYPAMNPLGIDSITRGIPGFWHSADRRNLSFNGNSPMSGIFLKKKIMEHMWKKEKKLD
ncbi:MAG: succinylglutamate desuccinylase/aspartoacylase family protein [Clostridiales bacterium]|nr:succinylglutamate desuccinylase/aspartoacylase family protein [Clostridiales bacterium]